MLLTAVVTAEPPLSPHELFKKASPSVVQVHVSTQGSHGQGSGFYVSSEGVVVTNYHVILNAMSATVIDNSKKRHDVLGVILMNGASDVALIKVTASNTPALKLSDPSKYPVGSRVYAIGHPEGLTNTLSEGLISGHRHSGGVSLIQITADITHGSSGGPLLTQEGTVIGITSSGFSGKGNLNFAVPASEIAVSNTRNSRVIPFDQIQWDESTRSTQAIEFIPCGDNQSRPDIFTADLVGTKELTSVDVSLYGCAIGMAREEVECILTRQPRIKTAWRGSSLLELHEVQVGVMEGVWLANFVFSKLPPGSRRSQKLEVALLGDAYREAYSGKTRQLMQADSQRIGWTAKKLMGTPDQISTKDVAESIHQKNFYYNKKGLKVIQSEIDGEYSHAIQLFMPE
jgi:hypothetical protein